MTKGLGDEALEGRSLRLEIVTLSLGVAKGRTGRQLRSEPFAAEARMSVIDAALALAVLVGLAVNALLGWWWADPVAALVVAVAAIHEGIENLEEARELEAPDPRDSDTRS